MERLNLHVENSRSRGSLETGISEVMEGPSLPCEPGPRRVPLCPADQERTLTHLKLLPPKRRIGALGANPRAPAGAARSRHRTPPSPPPNPLLGKTWAKYFRAWSRCHPPAPSPTPRGQRDEPRDSPERENVRDDFYLFMHLFIYFYQAEKGKKILSMSLKL